MFTMPGDGVGAVNGGVAFGGQKLGLGHIRPVGKVLGLAPVQFAYLLQANDVSIQLLYGLSQIVDF